MINMDENRRNYSELSYAAVLGMGSNRNAASAALGAGGGPSKMMERMRTTGKVVSALVDTMNHAITNDNDVARTVHMVESSSVTNKEVVAIATVEDGALYRVDPYGSNEKVLLLVRITNSEQELLKEKMILDINEVTKIPIISNGFGEDQASMKTFKSTVEHMFPGAFEAIGRSAPVDASPRNTAASVSPGDMPTASAVSGPASKKAKISAEDDDSTLKEAKKNELGGGGIKASHLEVISVGNAKETAKTGKDQLAALTRSAARQSNDSSAAQNIFTTDAVGVNAVVIPLIPSDGLKLSSEWNAGFVNLSNFGPMNTINGMTLAKAQGIALSNSDDKKCSVKVSADKMDDSSMVKFTENFWVFVHNGLGGLKPELVAEIKTALSLFNARWKHAFTSIPVGTKWRTEAYQLVEKYYARYTLDIYDAIIASRNPLLPNIIQAIRNVPSPIQLGDPFYQETQELLARQLAATSSANPKSKGAKKGGKNKEDDEEEEEEEGKEESVGSKRKGSGKERAAANKAKREAAASAAAANQDDKVEEFTKNLCIRFLSKEGCPYGKDCTFTHGKVWSKYTLKEKALVIAKWKMLKAKGDTFDTLEFQGY